MYIELYDRRLLHIANLTNIKYNYTRRTYDFDNAVFSGLCAINPVGAFIFVLCKDNGQPVYSGFVAGLGQDGKLVRFKGVDYKTIFDTEVILDYSTNLEASPRTLGGVFYDVVEALKNQILLSLPILPIDFLVPQDDTDIYWIANFDSQFVTVNAKTFLKPYLAYYGYYISSRFDRANKKLIFEVKKNTNMVDIKLADFLHDAKKNDLTVNKTIATIKFESIDTSQKRWVEVDKGYYDNQPGDNKDSIIQSDNNKPNIDPNEYETGYALELFYNDFNSVLYGYYYYSVAYVENPRPKNLPYREYYLGLDNMIYSGAMSFSNMVLPVKAKVFEDANFQNAQFNAIYELVNNRFNENITLTNVNSPIDLSKLELNTLVNIYDKNGEIKSMPVSEIINDNGLLQIKLGYKKTLFTEVIKGEAEREKPAIKPTSGGVTNIYSDEIELIGGEEIPIEDLPINSVQPLKTAETKMININGQEVELFDTKKR